MKYPFKKGNSVYGAYYCSLFSCLSERCQPQTTTAVLIFVFVLFVSPLLVIPTPMQAATTSLTVTKYDAHGNVLATKTVTWEWMRDNLLPVCGDGTQGKVDILHTDGESFRDAASQMKQQPDQKVVPEIGGCLLQPVYVIGF
jgi:hypothetical protein